MPSISDDLADAVAAALPGWVVRSVQRRLPDAPDDVYDLTPAHFGDVDESLVDLGLLWGAMRAWEHKRAHGG